MRIDASAFVALTLLAAACGGSAPSAPASEPAKTTTTATNAPPVTTAPPAPTTTASAAPAPSTSSDAAASKPEDAPAPADAPPPATEAELKADTRAANAFTLKMLARTKKEKGNVMVSGTSLRQALGAAYVGAAGATAKEIAATFGFPEDPRKAASAARAEIDAWQKARGQGAELTVANKIWVDKSMPVKPAYASLVAWAFGAPAQNVDFAKAPDEARRTVNGWVAEQTHDKIKDLLPEGSVDAKTRAVITNAIYFKGKWVNPFPKDATKDEPFKLDAKKTANVPTMHVTDQFRFAKAGNVKVIELRYIGNDLSLLVVLPDAVDGLAKLEETVTADQVDRWAAALQSSRVNLSMPKFTFKWGGSVKGALQDLGVKTAFTDKADFSGIAMKPGDLTVSDVFHETWVALDELGTEAAAATGTVMKLTSMATGPATEMKVDHPFLFFVRGKNRILFAGRVVEPKQ